MNEDKIVNKLMRKTQTKHTHNQQYANKQL